MTAVHNQNSSETITKIEKNHYTERIKKNFDRAAEFYDREASVQYQAGTALCALLHSGYSPSGIIDLGCGTGRITIQLSEKFPGIRCDGIDISEKMISIAKKNKRTSPSTCPGFFTGDLMQWVSGNIQGTNPAMYDLVFSNFTLQWIENLPLFLRQIREKSRSPVTLVFSIALKETFSELSDAVKSIIPEYKPAITQAELSGIADFVDAAGFSIITSSEHRIHTPFHSVYDVLRHVQRTGVGSPQNSGTFTPALLRRLETEWGRGKKGITYHWGAFVCRAK